MSIKLTPRSAVSRKPTRRRPTGDGPSQPLAPPRQRWRGRRGVVEPRRRAETVFSSRLSCYYGSFRAVREVNLSIERNRITAIIGPSGCGKSTLLRSINRMNDLVPRRTVDGQILYHGVDLYADGVDPVEVRRRIGMVFQKPNPFPKSIYDNVAFGPRGGRLPAGRWTSWSRSPCGAPRLWDEVKDKLKAPGTSLSGGQQQRLCIARAIAVEPEVLLMDEPCSALDPIATLRIEELMRELREKYTIVIVTHNMQQAARVSDTTVFLTMGDDRAGYLVEWRPPSSSSPGRQRADRAVHHRAIRMSR